MSSSFTRFGPFDEGVSFLPTVSSPVLTAGVSASLISTPLVALLPAAHLVVAPLVATSHAAHALVHHVHLLHALLHALVTTPATLLSLVALVTSPGVLHATALVHTAAPAALQSKEGTMKVKF